jgi:hypothetical protein
MLEEHKMKKAMRHVNDSIDKSTELDYVKSKEFIQDMRNKINTKSQSNMPTQSGLFNLERDSENKSQENSSPKFVHTAKNASA